MNNRIAKKILLSVSTLHKDRASVDKARSHYKDNSEWFLQKSIYLVDINDGCWIENK